MKTLVALGACIVTLLGVVLACSTTYAPPPQPVFDVTITLLSNGQPYAPGEAGVPAEATQVVVHASVTAPPGTWTLTLGSSSGLALGGAIDGDLSLPVLVQGSDPSESVTVDVAGTLAATNGSVFVYASIGSFQSDFSFEVQPATPTLTLCTAGADGGCSDSGTLDAGPGSVYVDDMGVEWLPAPQTPAGTGSLYDGDQVTLEISTAPQMPDVVGAAWSGSVTTEGVLWLAVSDGGLARTQTVQLPYGASSTYILGQIVGAGLGGAFVSVANGPTQSLFVQSGSALIWPRRVQFVEYAGLSARNLVTFCSTRSAGAVSASVDADGGALSSTNAALSVDPSGVCPAPFSGRADFVWTGSEANAAWTLTDDASNTSASVSIPMLAANPTVTPTNTIVKILNDGGDNVDASPGTVIYEVTTTLMLGEYDGGAGALSAAPVAVQTPNGVTAIPSNLVTDGAGSLHFEVVAPSTLAPLGVVLVVDQRLTVVIPVP
jgi:hypothetical protein